MKTPIFLLFVTPLLAPPRIRELKIQNKNNEIDTVNSVIDSMMALIPDRQQEPRGRQDKLRLH